ncbi:methyltransferase domain-containing protein [Mycobacterium riyadhense]|nr:methyltransferase domain-containing protein [Mycobacterium riyadhense]
MTMSQGSGVRYDAIGHDYAAYRRPDPRISAAVQAALGDAQTVVNVGAGAGSYEPVDRPVIPVDPSRVWPLQRARTRPPAVLGVAENLPLADGAVDAAMAVMTINHWADVDVERGLAELTRVAEQARRTTDDLYGCGSRNVAAT